MATDKNSFVLYTDLIHTVKKMSNEDAGQLLKTILSYVNDENPVVENVIVDLVFEPIKRQMKRDLKKWEKTVTTKSDNGRVGNLKRWHKDLYIQYINEEITLEDAENIAKHRKAIKDVANIADNVTVTDTVNVNDTVTSSTTTTEAADENKIPIPVNLLETSQSPEETHDVGEPVSATALGLQNEAPPEVDRGEIADPYKPPPKLSDDENRINLLSDQYGAQREAIFSKFSKKDLMLFDYVLKKFNIHRTSIGKEPESHNEYAKHLNNWLNKKGYEGIQKLTADYNESKNPIKKSLGYGY